MTAQSASRHGAGSRVLGWLLLVLLPGALAAQATAPLRVLTRAELVAGGRSELAEILQALVPALHASHPSNLEGSDHRRPTSFRGLGADHVLLLIDGKRSAESAFLTTGNTIGRGQGMGGPDWNAIPLAAIERIEVWGDGGTRYGSRAVAGVINIVLRREGNAAAALAGLTTAGDGTTLQLAGSRHFATGWRGGFLQVSGELRRRGATNRALPDPRPQYFPGDPRNQDSPQVDQRFGDPASTGVSGVLDFGQPLRGSVESYGFAQFNLRRNDAGDLWRTASDDRTVRGLYPHGFLPRVTPRLFDGLAVAGLRAHALAVRWDASLSYSRNSTRFDLAHTANTSLGPASPTRFAAGTLRADQFSVEVGGTGRVRPLRGLPALGVSAGVLHRSDGYQIEAGEPDSYRFGAVPIQDGPHAGEPAALGAQGFPGFRPSDAVIARRGMLAGYAELTAEPVERLALEAAGRVEYQRGLGTVGVWHLAGTATPWRALALNASLGTGFRAPSLAQTWYSRTTTAIVGRFGFNDLTVPVASPIAALLGAQPLRPERSRQLELGARWTGKRAGEDREPWTVGVSWYRVRVHDRIILSGRFDDPAVQTFLAQQGYGGVGGVRFFRNALATRTTGIDLDAGYGFRVRDAAVRLQAAFHHSRNSVQLTDSLPGLLALFTRVLFDRVERARLEAGLPHQRLILAGTATRGRWSLAVRAQRFGRVTSFGLPPDGSLDQTYGAEWLGDLSASYRLPKRVTLTLGADNVLNAYPDRNRYGDATTEGNSYYGMFPYPNVSPFGFQGRFVYLRSSWQR